MRQAYAFTKKWVNRHHSSFERMFLLHTKRANVVFCIKANWWNCVNMFIRSSLQVLAFVCRSNPNTFCLNISSCCHHKSATNKKNRKGEAKTFCSSLSDQDIYARKSLLNLFISNGALRKLTN